MAVGASRDKRDDRGGVIAQPANPELSKSLDGAVERTPAITFTELFSDEEEELFEQMGVLLRTKSEKELEAHNGHNGPVSSLSSVSGNSVSSTGSGTASARRREAPQREIPFWNVNHRKLVSLSLDNEEVRKDLNVLCIESAQQSQTTEGLKSRLRSRGGASDVGDKSLASGEQLNMSDRFDTHPDRKGWVTCKRCGTPVWPPNCRKHVAHCR